MHDQVRQIAMMQQQLEQQGAAIYHAQQQAAQATQAAPRGGDSNAIKPPKPDTFDGRNVDTFLYSLDKLFSFYNYHSEASSESKVALAVTFFRGSALRWYKYAEHMDVNNELTQWPKFTEALRAHFQASNTETIVRNKLAALRQLASVSRYNDLYNELIIEVLDIDQRSKVDMYVRGLKREVQLHVSLQSPATLEEAQRIAMNVDNIIHETGFTRAQPRSNTNFKHKSNNNRHFNNRGSGRSYNNYNSSSTPMELGQVEDGVMQDEYERDDDAAVTLAQANYQGRQRMSAEEQKQLMRDGRCFTCKQPGHLSRDCPNRNRQQHSKND